MTAKAPLGTNTTGWLAPSNSSFQELFPPPDNLDKSSPFSVQEKVSSLLFFPTWPQVMRYYISGCWTVASSRVGACAAQNACINCDKEERCKKINRLQRTHLRACCLHHELCLYHFIWSLYLLLNLEPNKQMIEKKMMKEIQYQTSTNLSTSKIKILQLIFWKHRLSKFKS